MRIGAMVKSHFVVGLVVALLSFSLPARVFVLREESDQLAQLLGEARTEAGELAKDADETESLIRSDVSWQTHAVMLDSVKEHVNNADTAHQHASTVSSLFEYEKTMNKMGELKDKLALNGH
jgi:hypothetical protein